MEMIQVVSVRGDDLGGDAYVRSPKTRHPAPSGSRCRNADQLKHLLEDQLFRDLSRRYHHRAVSEEPLLGASFIQYVFVQKREFIRQRLLAFRDRDYIARTPSVLLFCCPLPLEKVATASEADAMVTLDICRTISVRPTHNLVEAMFLRNVE
jgi:hypothetical protein